MGGGLWLFWRRSEGGGRGRGGLRCGGGFA